jgi:hypothetical protein
MMVPFGPGPAGKVRQVCRQVARTRHSNVPGHCGSHARPPTRGRGTLERWQPVGCATPGHAQVVTAGRDRTYTHGHRNPAMHFETLRPLRSDCRIVLLFVRVLVSACHFLRCSSEFSDLSSLQSILSLKLDPKYKPTTASFPPRCPSRPSMVNRTLSASTDGAGSYLQILEDVFPGAMPEDAFIRQATEVLNKHGFNPSTSINLVSTCRDEICRPFTHELDRIWGPSFSISSLAGMLFCGRAGVRAAMAHSPVRGGRERYVFWVMPHIALYRFGFDQSATSETAAPAACRSRTSWCIRTSLSSRRCRFLLTPFVTRSVSASSLNLALPTPTLLPSPPPPPFPPIPYPFCPAPHLAATAQSARCSGPAETRRRTHAGRCTSSCGSSRRADCVWTWCGRTTGYRI